MSDQNRSLGVVAAAGEGMSRAFFLAIPAMFKTAGSKLGRIAQKPLFSSAF
jgi:hypothetical protein